VEELLGEIRHEGTDESQGRVQTSVAVNIWVKGSQHMYVCIHTLMENTKQLGIHIHKHMITDSSTAFLYLDAKRSLKNIINQNLKFAYSQNTCGGNSYT